MIATAVCESIRESFADIQTVLRDLQKSVDQLESALRVRCDHEERLAHVEHLLRDALNIPDLGGDDEVTY